jgi:cytoskeletal protein CcmA (bactofilin family)
VGFEGDTLDRGVATARRAATDSITFLRNAAGVSRKADTALTGLAEATTPAGVSPATVLSQNVEISGSIQSRDELHIHGKVEGNVRAPSITICEGGSVKGDVIAEAVTINGKVRGRIYGRIVTLKAAADVEGDIFHSGLGMDTSSLFEGASRRVADPLAEFAAPASR